jgi:hypothetical protein
MTSMDRAALSKLLYDLDVPTSVYRLDGSHFELAHVLAERNGRWVVFLSERGTESDSTDFADEADACFVMLGRVCADLAHRDLLTVSNG